MYRVYVPNGDFHWYKTARNHILKKRITNFNVGYDNEKDSPYLVTTDEMVHFYLIFKGDNILTEIFTESFTDSLK